MFNTTSRFGFGNGPFGSTPFGAADFGGALLYDRLPSWLRDEDSRNGQKLKTFFDSFEGEFAQLYEEIVKLRDISDALSIDARLLPFLAASYNLSQEDDEDETQRRIEILSLTELIDAKGTGRAYEIVAAQMGLSVRLVRLYDWGGQIIEEPDLEEYYYFQFRDIPANRVPLTTSIRRYFQCWPYTPRRGRLTPVLPFTAVPLNVTPLNALFVPPPKLTKRLRVYIESADGREIQDFDMTARGFERRVESIKTAMIDIDYVYRSPPNVAHVSLRVDTTAPAAHVSLTLSNFPNSSHLSLSVSL